MKHSEIEYWALKVIDRVKERQPREDSKVELKTTWIGEEEAARRIAGHANAARGEPILWLVGIDEEKGVIGAEHKELANWWEKVKSKFDGDAPSLTDVNIRVDDRTVVALLLETDRAPFVVKNPSFGKTNGVVISREVPWREGTSTRTATRSDLLRLLVPVAHSPRVEVLGGELNCSLNGIAAVLNWKLSLRLYVEPEDSMVVVFPYHRCEVTFEVLDRLSKTSLSKIKIVPPLKSVLASNPANYVGLVSKPDTITVRCSSDEVFIYGPGKVIVEGSVDTEERGVPISDSTVRIDAKLVPSYGGNAVFVSEHFRWHEPSPEQQSQHITDCWS